MKSRLATEIGRRLRQMRVRRGLTQQRLAQLTEASPDYSYIGKIERGEQLPSLKVLERLARALGVPTGHFFQVGVGEVLLPEEVHRLARDEALHAILQTVARMSREDIPLLLEITRVLSRSRQKGLRGRLSRRLPGRAQGESPQGQRRVAEGREPYRAGGRAQEARAAIRRIEAALSTLGRRGDAGTARVLRAIHRALAALKTSL